MEEDIKRLKVLLIHAENTLLDEEAIALEHLIKAYKELEEENKNLKTRYDKYGRVLFTPEAIAEKHIPKSKTKEKIEENKGYLEYSNTAYEYTQKEVIEENIKTLEELLEGK